MRNWDEDEIEARASRLRQAIGVDELDWLDAKAVLNGILDLLPGVTLTLVKDSELPDPGGQWNSDDKRIILRKSVFEDGTGPSARPHARWTIVHEAMHAYLGHQGIRNRSAANSQEKRFSNETRRIETTTDKFTAAVLAPLRLIKPLEDALSIASRFGLSRSAAEIRAGEAARDYRRRNQLPRPIPDSVQKVIDELKAGAARPNCPRLSTSIGSEALKLWDQAARVPGEDPSEYRKSGSGYMIKKSQFQKVNAFGWFIERGEIHASIERHDCN